MTTTTPRYSARPADGLERDGVISEVTADTVDGLLDGAWQLNRYLEMPIALWDNTDNRKMAILRLDWLD